MHPEVTRDKNYHDCHANDVEDVHFVSSSRGTVHLRTERDCPALAYARQGFLSSAIAGASHDGLTPTAVTVIAAAARSSTTSLQR